MQYHRPTSLESLMTFATTSLQGRSDKQRSWDLHLAHEPDSTDLSALPTQARGKLPAGEYPGAVCVGGAVEDGLPVVVAVGAVVFEAPDVEDAEHDVVFADDDEHVAAVQLLGRGDPRPLRDLPDVVDVLGVDPTFLRTFGDRDEDRSDPRHGGSVGAAALTSHSRVLGSDARQGV